MASDNSSMPYSSLRPLPVGGRKPKNLGEFIARVQAERGFRNVTEASLQEEIRAQANGENRDEDAHMADESDEENDDDETKDINAVKADILRNIDSAHNAAMLSLDFVSLLLSKHSPNQAGATLSQALREFAGIGTLGVSKFADSMQDGDKRKREEKRKEARDISMGWMLMDIDQTKKTAEKATNNLSKEIERERAYWKEVMAVKQNGWSVCKLPNERHTLGVRFGFTEASPEFRSKSLAPLRRGQNGSVVLEHGRVGAGCQRVCVALDRKGETTGQSVMSSAVSDAAPLQTRVLEARNSIFSEELWHELHREAHSLASYGVRASDGHIIYEPKRGPKVTLALNTILDNAPDVQRHSDDKLAQLTQLSLHLLLSFAHRQNEMQRLRPAPPNQRRHQQWSQYHLLRPIISRTLHDTSIMQCTKFIGAVTRILRQVGISEASFTLQNPQISTADLISHHSSSSNRPTASQALVNMLTAPADFQIEATITPAARMLIRGRTWFLPLTTTQYQVNLLPPEGSTDPAVNSLQTSFPPYRDRDGYPDLNSLKTYLLAAVPHALVDYYLPRAESHGDPRAAENQNRPLGAEEASEPSWIRSVRGTSFKHAANEYRSVRFELVEKDEGSGSDETRESELDTAPELIIAAGWRVGDEPRAKLWQYSGSRSGGDDTAPVPVAEEIVRAVVTSSEVQ